MKISKLRDLIKLVEESKITELEISRFGTKVRISKQLEPSSDTKAPTSGLQIEVAQKTEENKTPEQKYEAIKAPMVGTFYRAPDPDADSYVELGDIVNRGQVVCIIEAMKVMNEIQSEIEGRVIRLPVDNESPVEYGQELFHLESIS